MKNIALTERLNEREREKDRRDLAIKSSGKDPARGLGSPTLEITDFNPRLRDATCRRPVKLSPRVCFIYLHVRCWACYTLESLQMSEAPVVIEIEEGS